ncbi:MAG: patatin-like phospholipase family protein, partial [Gemmatimonadota bacterium]|nr:patatin-like phospholipase family protein [Gemmatimonadota bacterium]
MTGSAPSRRADDPPVRLALVLGGRASAGAYAAGAASEILAALDRSPAGRVELAVLCGTSAGSLSAAVGARAMAVNPGLLPFLEKLWVEALDVRHLLEPGGRGTAGIFRQAPLLELGSALIAADPASDDRRARGVADTLSLGMTLSNLNGVPRRRRFHFRHAADRTCDVRVHRDAAAFRLGAATDAADPVWEVVRDAALASMATPFVLPPVELDRGKLSRPDARLAGAPDSGRMWFADGDWLAHEPIRLARRLARSSPGAEEADWRYVVVDPHLEDMDDDGVRPDTRIGVARAVARATLGRGSDHDWIASAELNARVELFESLVRHLPEVAEGLLDPDALDLGREIARLAEVAAEHDVARDGIDDEEAALERLDAELDRIGRDPRFAPALERTGTRAGRTRLAKLIYILESAGDLRDRRFLTLHRVAPRSGERLAGVSLGHLGGF